MIRLIQIVASISSRLSRYTTYTDDAESAVTKLDQMIREVENVRAAALRGRGGMGSTITPNGPTVGAPQAAPGGSLRDKYGLE